MRRPCGVLGRPRISFDTRDPRVLAARAFRSPEPGAAAPAGTLDWLRLDGFLDWYLLGVVAGLGVTGGAAGAGALRRLVYGALALAAAGAAVLVTALALPWWALGIFALVALASFVALRRLSPAALPAALAGSVVLAAVPALGYLLAAAAPAAGARLARRAGTRHAGLRVLAKD
jgi:hypothetical protein